MPENKIPNPKCEHTVSKKARENTKIKQIFGFGVKQKVEFITFSGQTALNTFISLFSVRFFSLWFIGLVANGVTEHDSEHLLDWKLK